MSEWKCLDTAQDVEQFIERNSFMNARKFFGLHGEFCHISLTCEKEYLEGYNQCPPLKSLVGKRAKAFNMGMIQTVNQNTKKEVKSGRAAEIRKLVKKPNVLQTESQFMSQHNHYIDIFGYVPVLKIRAAGMENISSIWNIPPWLFDIEYTRKWLRQAKVSGIYEKYFINWNGERAEIPFKDLFFVFDDGIGTDWDTNLTIPDSRLLGADYVVSNIIAALKGRNTLITKRGAIGILSNEGEDDDGTTPLRPSEKEDLQKDFAKYGLVGQAYQVIVTDANLKWQQMGFPTKDLLLFEEVDSNTGHLCDLYGTPPILMATSKVGTYENQNQARKDFIQNTIMPESESRMEQFSLGLIEDNDEQSSNLAIVRDYSKLPVLQDDKVQAATARKTLDEALEKEYLKGLITKNMWLEKLGEEPVEEDDSFNEYYDEAAAKQEEHQRAIEIVGAKGANKKLPTAA